MRLFHTLFLAAGLACLFAAPALAKSPAGAGTIILIDNTPAMKTGDTIVRLPADMHPVNEVQNSPLHFVAASPEDEGTPTVTSGIYFFNKDGKPAGMIPTPDAHVCMAASLSPDGTLLALDFGTSQIREWKLFSYPALKPLQGGKSIWYVDILETKPLIWGQNNRMFYSVMDTESKRVCDYDPCGPVSVHAFDPATGKETTVKEGTLLCDYFLQDVSGSQVTVGRRCLKKVEDWKPFPENVPIHTENIPLP